MHYVYGHEYCRHMIGYCVSIIKTVINMLAYMFWFKSWYTKVTFLQTETYKKILHLFFYVT